MVKRISAVLAAMLLLLAAHCALALDVTVVDEAALYSADEIAQMEEMISRIRDTYQMDVVVLTTNAVPSSYGDDSVTVRYADAWYENHGCGLGEDRAGVLLIVDMNNRFNYLSTAGVMIDYLTDRRIDGILTSADDDLSYGRYGRAMISELGALEFYLSRGIEEGSFRYDEVTGQRLTGLYNKLTNGELGFALLAGVAAAAIMFFVVKGRYQLSGGTYHYNKSTNAHMNMLINEGTFTHQKVSRVRIIESGGSGGGGHSGGHSGGSGVHISSGGMSHGGGGHHF